MNKDPLHELFDSLQGSFDVEEPQEGHEERFYRKLKKSTVAHAPKKFGGAFYAIAATLAFIVGLGFFYTSIIPTKEERLAEISPEVPRTQMYFASLIEEQVKLLEAEKNPSTSVLVTDTLEELQKLERDYEKLEEELLEGGNSKHILSAMITNFQTRIDLLTEVMNTIESIKEINTENHETFTI